MERSDEARLAVLIDADNTSAKWADDIFEEIATLGEASVRRIYGDFSGPQLRGWEKKLARLALIPHQQFAYTKGKNSSDIALVIEAMDLMHTGRFDGFVVVSSDSDFARLASRLREQGLQVFGIGRRNTPEAFRKACKRFIFIENLLGDGKGFERPKNLHRSRRWEANRARRRNPSPRVTRAHRQAKRCHKRRTRLPPSTRLKSKHRRRPCRSSPLRCALTTMTGSR